MFNTEEILARLAAGESIEAIANEAADALNAAKAAHDKKIAEAAAKKAAEEAARKAAEEEAKRQAEIRQAGKIAAATKITDAIFNYIDQYHSSIFADEKDRAEFKRLMNGADFAAIMDECFKLTDALNLDFTAVEKPKIDNKKNKPTEFTIEVNRIQDPNYDPIKDFLEKNSLL